MAAILTDIFERAKQLAEGNRIHEGFVVQAILGKPSKRLLQILQNIRPGITNHDLSRYAVDLVESFKGLNVQTPSPFVYAGGRIALLFNAAQTCQEKFGDQICGDEHIIGALTRVDGSPTRSFLSALGITAETIQAAWSATDGATEDSPVDEPIRPGAIMPSLGED